MLLTLLGFCLIETLAIITPGPDFFIVLRSSLRHGRLSGFFVGLGVASGGAICVSLIILLLDYLQTRLLFFTRWISLVGGCYLLYMAYKCYKSTKHKMTLYEPDTNVSCPSKLELYSSGLICNLTNPKAIIFFFSVIPIFMLKCPTITCGTTIVIMVFFISFIWYSFLSFIGGSTHIREKLMHHMSKLDAVFSIILAGFALFLIWTFINPDCITK